MPEIRPSWKYICTLPAGEWRLRQFEGKIYCVEPYHMPMLLTNDGLEPISYKEAKDLVRRILRSERDA